MMAIPWIVAGAAAYFGYRWIKQDSSKPHELGSEHTPQSASKVLGLKPSASWPEIKTAYTEKIQQVHPDKCEHLAEEFKTLAKKRSRELNSAYQFLRKTHGRP